MEDGSVGAVPEDTAMESKAPQATPATTTPTISATQIPPPTHYVQYASPVHMVQQQQQQQLVHSSEFAYYGQPGQPMMVQNYTAPQYAQPSSVISQMNGGGGMLMHGEGILAQTPFDVRDNDRYGGGGGARGDHDRKNGSERGATHKRGGSGSGVFAKRRGQSSSVPSHSSSSRVHQRRARCRHWSRGNCLRGDSCSFQHSGFPGSGLRCRHWAKGNCKVGDMCKFSHSGNAGDAMQCWHWALRGRCLRGDTCKFPHSGNAGDITVKEVVELGGRVVFGGQH
jgi:hypothetical protein